MDIREKLGGVLRRAKRQHDGGEKRKTKALPQSILGHGARNEPMPKPTPVNLRRFAETPVARKAINTIKDRIAGMQWRIQPRRGRGVDEVENGATRIALLNDVFERPNADDSFRSMAEQVLEDIIVGGFGAIELRKTGNTEAPLELWPVDGATIKLRADWDGRPESPRYVQVTGKFGPDGQVVLSDEELSYIRLNPRTHTPFGLGRLEVAFETIANFLSAHRHAAKLANNTVAQYALWLDELDAVQHERLIRWWQDEVEGTGKVPIMSSPHKPEVVRFGAGTDSDLRLQWQEFLLRIIADAFDLPPMFLGVEGDVNRSTAGELSDQAFHTAIVPTAKLFAEHMTRDVIGKRMGWHDLEFVFCDVDAPNELAKSEVQERLLRCGVLTVNEVRQMRGLAPLQSS
jgi:phage portal protein BeeE